MGNFFFDSLKNTRVLLLPLKRRTKDAPLLLLLLFSEEGEEEEEHHHRRVVVPLRGGISLLSRGF